MQTKQKGKMFQAIFFAKLEDCLYLLREIWTRSVDQWAILCFKIRSEPFNWGEYLKKPFKNGLNYDRTPYSPDLTLWDFFLLPELKRTMKERCFSYRVHCMSWGNPYKSGRNKGKTIYTKMTILQSGRRKLWEFI